MLDLGNNLGRGGDYDAVVIHGKCSITGEIY